VGCRNRTEARQSGVGEGKSQKPEEGSELEDILKQNFGQLNDDRLYPNMDRLYGKRALMASPLGRGQISLRLKQSIIDHYALNILAGRSAPE